MAALPAEMEADLAAHVRLVLIRDLQSGDGRSVSKAAFAAALSSGKAEEVRWVAF